MLAALATGCSPSSTGAATPSALDRVNNAGTLKAGYISYPPSMIVDPSTGQKSGIMVEVMDLIAKGMDIKVEYAEETTWATMIEAVDGVRVDVIVTGLWPSGRRARRAAFTDAVYYSPVYAFVRAGDTRFDGKLASANAATARIATIAAEDFPAATIVSLPQSTDVAQLLLQLTTDKADITFVEGVIAEGFITKNPGSIVAISGVEAVRVFPNTFMVAKGESQLLNTINVGLAELHNSGAINRILAKYDPTGRLFLRVRRPYD
jgi:ABC-type amino acid transport substrate-binding protein